ncbi:MAG TPA: AzlD domain-containing protein [Coriobacteriia bacterium]|nr:AzlD domain-containing protein [Coriobacteriia bacterium]
MIPEVSPPEILALIAGMAVINFALRMTPLALLSERTLPAPVVRWLSYIPISVMGALVATEVLLPGGEWQSPFTSPGLYAAVLTMVVFRLTRSFLGATLAGMVSFVVLGAFLG